MPPIPIVRAAHLLLYFEALREIGSPVDRDLAVSRLPGWIEEKPEAYVSIPLALDVIAKCKRDVTIPEIGYLAAQKMSPHTVDPALKLAVMTTCTTFARISAISRLAHRENSSLQLRTRREGGNIRIICDMPTLRGTPFFSFAEWLNLAGLASLLGAGAGPTSHPLEMTFVCPTPQCDAALKAYDNTRILTGQPQSSLLVASELLMTPGFRPVDPDDTQQPLGEITRDWNFVSTLRSALRPYLCEDTPTLALAAEISGLSGRTLQRRLAASGQSYSKLIQDTRFEIARDMLVRSDAKIIEVAMACGYENPQHFSRAFRRNAGMTPKTYRRMAAENGSRCCLETNAQPTGLP